jgi:HEAT repeat protein
MKNRIALLLLFVVPLVLAVVTSVRLSPWVAVGFLRNEDRHEGKPASYWIDQLENESERQSALNALPNLGTSAAEAVLWKLGQHCARRRGRVKNHTAMDRVFDLLALTQHQRPPRSDLLLEAVHRIGPRAGPVYIQATTNKEPSLRQAAMEALGVIGRRFPDAVLALAKGLNDKDSDVQGAAIEGLDRIGRKGKAAVPALSGALPCMCQENVDKALRVLVSMGRSSKEAVPALAPMLDDPDFPRRIGGAYCLIKTGGLTGVTLPKIIEALVPILEATDSEWRSEAAYCLVIIGEPAQNVLPRICVLLDDKTLEDNSCFGSILENLRPHHPAVIPTLLRALTDPEHRSHASKAISHLQSRGKDAAPAITKLLCHEDPQTRIAAADVLACMGTDAQTSLPFLRKMLNDEDELVRLAAAQGMWYIQKDADIVVATIEKLLKEVDRNPLVLFEATGKSAEVEGVNAPVSRRSQIIEACARLVVRIGAQAKALEVYLLEVNLETYPRGKDTIYQALGAIGPDATKAIPTLLNAVAKHNNVHAALALWRITGDTRRAVPCLIGAVERGSPAKTAADKTCLYQLEVPARLDEMDRIIQAGHDYKEALECLAEMGCHGREAGATVMSVFRANKDVHDRLEVAMTLVKLGENSDELVMFLANVVEEEAGILVDTACSLLAEMGPRASGAIPVLKAVVEENDEQIVKAIADALKKIECAKSVGK